MEVSINYLAVVLAGLSTMVVGSIWYSPKVFGSTWMNLAKVKPQDNMSMKQAFVMYGGVLAASLITAYVLAYMSFLSAEYFHGSFLQNTLTVAVLLWAGFTAARIFTHDTFEVRRKKLTALNAAHELVTIIVMALIIGALGLPGSAQ